MFSKILASVIVSQLCLASSLMAAIVGREDFDGGAIGLISSNVPSIDGGGGDTHAIGSTGTWPTTGGVPFGFVDNSVGAVGSSTFFAADTEGVFGVNSSFTNRFLGISDTRPDNAGFGTVATPVISTWNFDISNATNLELSIGMGSMEGSTFNYSANTQFLFTYSIDGGQTFTAFNVRPDTSLASISFRPIDVGTFTTGTDYLSVTGDNSVTKLLSDTGLVASNLYLDKAPASGAGAGILDTFRTSLNGQGSVLTLTLSSYIEQEAAVFDNIQLDGVVAVPEPASFVLLGLSASALWIRRRRR